MNKLGKLLCFIGTGKQIIFIFFSPNEYFSLNTCVVCEGGNFWSNTQALDNEISETLTNELSFVGVVESHTFPYNENPLFWTCLTSSPINQIIKN